MTAAEAKPRDPLLKRILTEGAPPEPAPPSDSTSERILAAASEQVEDFGLRRFTIDDVARRLRISRVTIYRYFPKRDRLLEAVLLREMHRFLRAIDEAIEPCKTLEERLVEGVVFALSYLRRHRLLQRVLRTEPELILPALTVNAGRLLAAGREFIAGFERREAERGGLPLAEEEIEAVAELLARAVVSFLLTPDSVLGMRTDAEVRRFAEHYLAPTLRALTELPKGRTR
jgi:AcrR family transcriptional regulator